MLFHTKQCPTQRLRGSCCDFSLFRLYLFTEKPASYLVDGVCAFVLQKGCRIAHQHLSLGGADTAILISCMAALIIERKSITSICEKCMIQKHPIFVSPQTRRRTCVRSMQICQHRLQRRPRKLSTESKWRNLLFTESSMSFKVGYLRYQATESLPCGSCRALKLSRLS